MENVSVNMLYNEMKVIRRKIEHLEEILIPEEQFSEKELNEIDRLRTEALQEHKKKETVKISDL